MRIQPRFLLAISLLLGVYMPVGVHAQSTDADIVSVEAVELLDNDALRELVSPVALYPDDLLSHDNRKIELTPQKLSWS